MQLNIIKKKYACLRRLRHWYEEARNYGKILFIQNIVENGWWGMHAQHTRHPSLLVQ